MFKRWAPMGAREKKHLEKDANSMAYMAIRFRRWAPRLSALVDVFDFLSQYSRLPERD
jgi:hypothetical protein